MVSICCTFSLKAEAFAVNVDAWAGSAAASALANSSANFRTVGKSYHTCSFNSSPAAAVLPEMVHDLQHLALELLADLSMVSMKSS